MRTLRFTLAFLLLFMLGCMPTRASLPIEVMSASGTATASRTYAVPAGTTITALSLRVNGIEYPREASVSITTSAGSGPTVYDVGLTARTAVYVNGGAPIPLDNAHTSGDAFSRGFGGIGGPVATQSLTVALTPFQSNATVKITFVFNGTDGVSSGYRVLSLNLLDANGNEILLPSAFTQDNPRLWISPLNDAADIAAGQQLWQSANLRASSLPGAAPIKAHCADCHTEDGRDLQLFNFSNASISIRAQFHGLTALQGKQIASYIRSLPYKSVGGRPWNPPYQPGPGLDSLPINEWVAGAGIDAVLSKDADMLPYVFPNGIQEASVDTHAYLNLRELPQAYALPDWNQWLPRVHPLDSPWAARIATEGFYLDYFKLDSQLAAAQSSQSLPTYIATKLHAFLEHWVYADGLNFVKFIRTNYTYLPSCTPDISQAVYSTFQWRLVKEFDLMTRYNLQEVSLPYFHSYGPSSIPDTLIEPRSWFTQTPFNTSPHAIGLPEKDGQALNGSVLYQQYFLDGWYHAQMVLQPGSGRTSDQSPFDYNYSYGAFSHTTALSGLPNALWVVAVMAKGGQESNDNRGAGTGGWDPATVFEFNQLLHIHVYQGNAPEWAGLDEPTQVAIMNAMLDSWNRANAQYTPAQMYAISSGYGSASTAITPGLHPTDAGYAFPNKVYDILNLGAQQGLDPTLLNALDDWAALMWPSPQNNWQQLKVSVLQGVSP